MAGVVGWPVAHSWSPRLHGHWIRRYGIDAAYVPLPVRPADFAVALRGLAACGFRGVNVTIPHKQAAFAACATLTPAASRAGTVNTLVFDDGIVRGDNTDGIGFMRSLQARGVAVRRPALLLGAGGATRAIAAALQDAGADVTICARDRAAAEALTRQLPPATALEWSNRHDALGDFGLLVNTTSGGMIGMPPLEMDLGHAAPDLVVADIVYVPRRTPLLEQAACMGRVTVEGTEMLLHQAVPGFHAWFGVEPVVDAALRDCVLVA